MVAILRTRAMHRRSFLRGLGGAAIALPVLEAMLDDHGEALAASPGMRANPQRFLVAFNGQSLGADRDPVHNLYAPDKVGADYDLKTATMPLGDYGDLRSEVSIISGLRMPYGVDPIPAGGWASGFHIQALGPLISGVRNTSEDDFGVNGPTADQLVADQIAGDTKFKSLQYQVQASWYLTVSAPYGRDILAYRQDGDQLVAMPGQTSPRAAWESLFSGFIPDDADDAAEAAYQLAKRRSILDGVGASSHAYSVGLAAPIESAWSVISMKFGPWSSVYPTSPQVVMEPAKNYLIPALTRRWAATMPRTAGTTILILTRATAMRRRGLGFFPTSSIWPTYATSPGRSPCSTPWPNPI